MILVDSHCHLDMCDLSPYDGELSGLVQAAHDTGVVAMLNIGTNCEDSPQVVATAEKFPNIYASVGIHPHDAMEDGLSLDPIRELAKNPKVIALGEMGLDYYYHKEEADHKKQQDIFDQQLKMAIEFNLPVIIHTRDAQEDTLRLLQDNPKVRGVLHCFTETWEMAERALEMGFYVSISGIVTFKNAKQVADVASKVPLDRLLIETDSPFLAPVPKRGKKNEPRFVAHVAEYIAGLRGMDPVELAAQTARNFSKLFNVAVPGID